MNPLLEQLEQHLIASGVTVPIMLDTLMEKPDDAVAIYEYQGINALPQFAVSLRSIQIVVRAKTVAKATLLIGSIYNMFLTDDGIVTIGTMAPCPVNLRQRPFKLKTDEKGRLLYCFNMGITTNEK